MILCDRDLKELLESEKLSISPSHNLRIGPTSIDLTLSENIAYYTSEVIDLGKITPNILRKKICPINGFILAPNEFILASTVERVRMPNGFQGFIETKGDIARAGLQVHNADGHIDPGSDHTITLEIKNNNSIPIILYPCIPICQIFIHQTSGLSEKPYKGKYFGQTSPTGYIVR